MCVVGAVSGIGAQRTTVRVPRKATRAAPAEVEEVKPFGAKVALVAEEFVSASALAVRPDANDSAGAVVEAVHPPLASVGNTVGIRRVGNVATCVIAVAAVGFGVVFDRAILALGVRPRIAARACATAVFNCHCGGMVMAIVRNRAKY